MLRDVARPGRPQPLRAARAGRQCVPAVPDRRWAR
ncbi:phage DNA packaging protein J [Sphaerisporangium dianthi]|uniref:Phage DNA packaging protein J n=1 Tax=Sphaerisporangium dianthi TaxID=1436120 RepID=A0ABV9CIQ1_9ACTN